MQTQPTANIVTQAAPTPAPLTKIEIQIRRLETPAATASTGGRGVLSMLLGRVVS